MTRDVSACGVQFKSPTRFQIGERLILQFAVGSGPALGAAQGRVVRTEIDNNLHSTFHFCTAVEFEAPLLDLEETLQSLGSAG